MKYVVRVSVQYNIGYTACTVERPLTIGRVHSCSFIIERYGEKCVATLRNWGGYNAFLPRPKTRKQ